MQRCCSDSPGTASHRRRHSWLTDRDCAFFCAAHQSTSRRISPQRGHCDPGAVRAVGGFAHVMLRDESQFHSSQLGRCCVFVPGAFSSSPFCKPHHFRSRGGRRYQWRFLLDDCSRTGHQTSLRFLGGLRGASRIWRLCCKRITLPPLHDGSCHRRGGRSRGRSASRCCAAVDQKGGVPISDGFNGGCVLWHARSPSAIRRRILIC
mmetsp:Transcript_23811/g.52446  ORF Transcript_23811/g.52446 Transcript_23811/m.52446 type:complete len:206 (+) Transcript_23811:687-1304(+)